MSIAAPVGPIGLLVIQRTLQRGAALGLATGLGAAAADAAYGAVGAFGVSSLIQWLQSLRVPLALAGGAFLLWLAFNVWRTPPAAHAAPVRGARGLISAFAGTFVLTLSNPATILSFVAVFGTLGAQMSSGTPWAMIAGVLVGSALWWLFLCSVVGAMRSRFDARWQQCVNRASAMLLAAFALWPLWQPGTLLLGAS